MREALKVFREIRSNIKERPDLGHDSDCMPRANTMLEYLKRIPDIRAKIMDVHSLNEDGLIYPKRKFWKLLTKPIKKWSCHKVATTQSENGEITVWDPLLKKPYRESIYKTYFKYPITLE